MEAVFDRNVLTFRPTHILADCEFWSLFGAALLWLSISEAPEAIRPPVVTLVSPEIVFERAKRSGQLPEHVPYLLVGAGTASFAAFRAIRGHDANAKVGTNAAIEHMNRWIWG